MIDFGFSRGLVEGQQDQIYHPFGSGMENVENQRPSEGLADAAAGRSSSTVGATLRRAREAAGLTLPQIAVQTRIAERHLSAIEEDRLGDLAARTYAVGFSRTYARALGLDDKAVAEQVRRQLDAEGAREPVVVPHFEPGDPARVPSVRLAWVAAAGAVVVIALLLVFWSSYLSPEGKLPDLTSDTPKPAATVAATQAPAPAPQPTNGPVVLTATVDGVWLRVTDTTGKLLEKTLKQGESWTVPQGAQAPQLRLGRPDGLAITVGGKAIAPLATKPTVMSGVSLTPADLLARGQATPAPGTPAAPAPAATVPTAGAPAPSALSTTSN